MMQTHGGLQVPLIINSDVVYRGSAAEGRSYRRLVVRTVVGPGALTPPFGGMVLGQGPQLQKDGLQHRVGPGSLTPPLGGMVRGRGPQLQRTGIPQCVGPGAVTPPAVGS